MNKKDFNPAAVKSKRTSRKKSREVLKADLKCQGSKTKKLSTAFSLAALFSGVALISFLAGFACGKQAAAEFTRIEGLVEVRHDGHW